MISLRVIYTDDTYFAKSVKTFLTFFLKCPQEFRGGRFYFGTLVHGTRQKGQENKEVIQSILRRKVATLFRRLRSEKVAPAGQF
jgi:hypothetical protein